MTVEEELGLPEGLEVIFTNPPQPSGIRLRKILGILERCGARDLEPVKSDRHWGPQWGFRFDTPTGKGLMDNHFTYEAEVTQFCDYYNETKAHADKREAEEELRGRPGDC